MAATGASSGSTLSLASINANDTAYAANHGAITTRLGQAGNPLGWFLTQVWDRHVDRPFFSSQQAMLQLGQINLSNPVLSGARVTGAQWMSEPALPAFLEAAGASTFFR